MEDGQLALITLDNHIKLKDGVYYSVIAGACYIIPAEDLLGLTPNGNRANWFLMIGHPNNKDRVLIAGCQVHFAQFLEEEDLDKLTGVPVLK